MLDDALYDHETPCDWTSGSFMLARKAPIDDVGGMDERFFLYCEETDFCLRMREAGWTVVHFPQMTILHQSRHDGGRPTEPADGVRTTAIHGQAFPPAHNDSPASGARPRVRASLRQARSRP